MPDGGFNPWVYCVFGAAVVVLFSALYSSSRKYMAAFRALIASLGLKLDENQPQLSELELTGLQIFKRGHAHRAWNQVSGATAGEAEVKFFSYSFEVGYGKNNLTRLAAALFTYKDAIFPSFELRPEGPVDRLKAFFGWEDIDIPGFEDFSYKYFLSGPDKNAVLAFWTPERIKHFESRPGWQVEANGKFLLLLKGYYSMEPTLEQYPEFMERAKNVAVLLSGK